MCYRIVLMLILCGLSLAASGQDAQPAASPAQEPAQQPTPKADESKTPNQSSSDNGGGTSALGALTTIAAPVAGGAMGGIKSREDTKTSVKSPNLVDQCLEVWRTLGSVSDRLSVIVAICAVIVAWLAWRVAAKQLKLMDTQTYAQLNALRLQARMTQLSQVKLRLETVLRGDTMSLRDNALPTAKRNCIDQTPSLSDDQKDWVNLVVNQICGDSPSAEHKALVTDLATQWVALEQSMQDAYQEVEKSLVTHAENQIRC